MNNGNENTLQAIDLHRIKHKLLTSNEISDIRRYYDISQRELSLLLGWNEDVVSKFETRIIQGEIEDMMMRMAYEVPVFALENLERNIGNFSDQEFSCIKEAISIRISEKEKYFENEFDLSRLDEDDDEAANAEFVQRFKAMVTHDNAEKWLKGVAICCTDETGKAYLLWPNGRREYPREKGNIDV